MSNSKWAEHHTASKDTQHQAHEMGKISPLENGTSRDLPPTDTSPHPDEHDSPHTWYDFSQNTTFHGVKYIFNHAPNYKRLLWLLAVLTAIGLFITQVTLRAKAYLQYDTIVNVKINYDPQVQFPVVTFCNQNSYRLSALYQEGLHTLTNDYYKAGRTTELNLASFNLSRIDTETFLKRTAHQLSDLIDSCQWNGEECDLEEDFVTTLTDVGVCYSFNSQVDGRPQKMANNQGIGSGLKIMFNLEKYEYTRGPHNDEGLKFLLHDNDEIPIMNDKGATASSGEHTLVGINLEQLHLMDPPHGDCTKGAEDISLCKLRCKAEYVYEKCGCVDNYVARFVDEYQTVCNMQQRFGCALPRAGDLTEILKECDQCPIPCEDTKFTPTMSFAQMSKANIERHVTQKPGQKAMVRESYYKAVEIRNRVNPDQVTQFYMAGILQNSSYLAGALVQMNATLSNPQLVSELEEFANVLDESYNYVQTDYSLFENELSQLRKESLDVIELIPQAVKLNSVLQLMSKTFDSTTNGTFALLDECYINNTMNMTHCQTLALLMLVKIDEIGASWMFKEFFDSLDEKYRNLLELAQEPTANDLCVEALDWYSNTGQQTVDDLALRMYAVYQQISSSDDATRAHEEIQTFRTLMASDEYITFRNLFNKSSELTVWNCEVLASELHTATNVMFERFENNHRALLGAFTDMRSSYEKFYDYVGHLIGFQEENISPLARNITEYNNRTITKRTLAEMVAEMALSSNIGDFEGQILQLDFLANTLITAADSTNAYTGEMVEMVTGFIVPLDENSVNRTLLWQLINQHRDSALYQVAYEYMNSDFREGYKLLIELHYLALKEAMQRRANILMSLGLEVVDYAKELTKELENFLYYTKMDSAFYARNYAFLDIYYPELSYKVTNQMEAFPILSFFSEIGGFMGLLLGASVLTVCELIDFIMVSVYGRIGNPNYNVS